MVEIIPAIIGQDFGTVAKKIKQVSDLASWVQLDIMDGHFVPEESWRQPADLADWASPRPNLEVHLMISEPEKSFESWLPVCDRLIIHLESTVNAEQILRRINLSRVEAGVALLLPTPLDKLEPVISLIKTVQLMSIATVGHYGEKLDERVYERIKILRAQYPNVKINVDGGVNLENAKKLIEAGADRLVVGSAIWQAENISEAIDALRRQN